MQKISHFTSRALFHPTSGYYRTRNPLDDFVTAPEISQVFGELIAAYLLQISSTKKSKDLHPLVAQLEAMPQTRNLPLNRGKISLVEMGAGKGTLLRDILVSVKKLAEKKNLQAADFLEHTMFHIIEINEVLKKIQQENLKNFSVTWHENFSDFLREADEIFFISNELFDCFPIDQFVKTDIGWCERLIGSGKFITKNFDPEIHQFVQNLVQVDAPFGAVFEHSFAAKSFMAQLCEALKTRGGIAINFDYGYVKTEFANTLQAVKNHQKVEVLKNVGEADITAHVDFSALEKIAKNFELNSSLITQREFLISLGIEERRKILPPSENSAIDRLISLDQMGELFKTHIIWKNS